MPMLPLSATTQRITRATRKIGVRTKGDDVQGQPLGEELAEDDERGGEDEGQQ